MPRTFDAAFIASAQALVVTGTHFHHRQVDRTSRQAIAHARASGTKVALDIDYRPRAVGADQPRAGRGTLRRVDRRNAASAEHRPTCDLVVGTEEENPCGRRQHRHVRGAARPARDQCGDHRRQARAPRAGTVYSGPSKIRPTVRAFRSTCSNVLGAGNAFMAGCCAGWLRGESWKLVPLRQSCRCAGGLAHGLRAAMPSADELSDFLARSDRPGKSCTRSADDASYNRVTTAARSDQAVLALAFDHRRQFEIWPRCMASP